MNDLERKKAVYDLWQSMTNDFRKALALTGPEDKNVKAINKDGNCAGILRFGAQLNNYCEHYRREFLEEVARSLE